MSTNKLNQLLFACCLLLSAFCILAFAQGGTGKLPPVRKLPPPIRNPPMRRDPPTNRAPSCSAKSPTKATGRTHIVNLPGGVKLEMVEIPAGSFCMGSMNGDSDEKPVHKVAIRRPFYVGTYEVTQAQWNAVMGDNPSFFKECPNCPVEKVQWEDVDRFLTHLNDTDHQFAYRLPTEAEWEYACRAGTTGDYAGNLDGMAWYQTNSGNRTHPVGTKQPNNFGLYDFHGNVWEWCFDLFHDNYDGAPTDGNAWLSGGEPNRRLLRGGSWNGDPAKLRAAARHWINLRVNPTRDHYSEVGFRVVAVARPR